MGIIERIKKEWKNIDWMVSQRLKEKYDSDLVKSAMEARLEKYDEEEEE